MISSKHLMKRYYFLALIYIIIICHGCRKSFEITANVSSIHNLSDVISKPNILLIIGDDVGYEVPTFNGGQSYTTTNLDKISRNGMRFSQCHGSALCAPSRITLLTGKYNFRNYTEFGYLSPEQKTIANMLGDQGYATCYTGKWQLSGGDNFIKAFGWNNYSVWLPFLLEHENQEGSRYKSAKIYQDGGYMPDNFSLGKYSDDIFSEYLMKFMDSVYSLQQPFFAYYSMILCHAPFSPTPDDPEYATWDFAGMEGDPVYFPSMVKYMDKKIGQILQHMLQRGMLQNTVVMYLGDNGTPPFITSLYNGVSITGGKGQINELGTNLPFVTFWNGRVVRNIENNALINLTDFLPTLADIAGIPRPIDYGPLDGISFYPLLRSSGDTSAKRNTIFNSYCVAPVNHPWRRWVQNENYKLYDTNRTYKAYKFVKIGKCQPDSAPLENLTDEEKILSAEFRDILRSYDNQ